MATEAVQLLAAINQSIKALSAQFATLKGGLGEQQRDAVDDAKARAERKARKDALDTTLAHNKMMKSSLIEGAKELRGKQKLREMAARAAVQLEAAAKGAKNSAQRMQILDKYLGEFGDALHGLSDDQLREVAKQFENSTGMMKGFDKVVEMGGHAVRDWIDRHVEAVKTTDTLIRTYRELRRANADMVKDTKLQIRLGEELQDALATMTRAGINVDQSLVDLADQLSKGAVKSAKDINDAFIALHGTAQNVDKDLQGVISQLSAGTTSIVEGLKKASRQSIVTTDNMMKAGGLVLGWNALMGNDKDGSSVVGDAMSGINTNVNSGWIATAVSGILTGMSPQALREFYGDSLTGGGLTAAELGKVLEDHRPSLTGEIQAAGGQAGYQQFMAITAKGLTGMGESAARIADATANVAFLGNDLQKSGFQSRDAFAAMIASAEQSSAMFTRLTASGANSVDERAAELAQMVKLGRAAGYTADQVYQLAEHTANLRNQGRDQWKTQLKAGLKLSAMFGVDASGFMQAMTGQLSKEQAQDAMAQFNSDLAGVTSRFQNGFMGVVQGQMFNENIGAATGGMLNGVTDAEQWAARRANVRTNMSDDQAAAAEAVRGASNAQMIAQAKLADQLGITEGALYSFITALGGISQNGLASAIGGAVGGILSVAMYGMAARGIGAVFGKIGPILGKIPGLGRLGGMLGSLGGGAGAGTSAAARVAAAGAGGAAGATGTGMGLRGAGRMLGRAAVPLAAVTGGYFAYSDSIARGESGGEAMSRGGGALVGGGLGAWGGAMAGASLGALGGPLAPVTVPLGALVGGALGAWGGSEAGDAIGGAAYDGLTDESGDPARPATDARDRLIDVHQAILQTGGDQVSELQKLNHGMEVLIGAVSNPTFAKQLGSRNIRSFRRTASEMGLAF